MKTFGLACLQVAVFWESCYSSIENNFINLVYQVYAENVAGMSTAFNPEPDFLSKS